MPRTRPLASSATRARRSTSPRVVLAHGSTRPTGGSTLLQAVRAARDAIDRDFGQPLRLDQLATTAQYSKFHFARAFAGVYGETPRAYLTRRRIERAKDLLRSANLTITEVCMLVGFESLGSFSARFKALVGMSPSEYRRQATRETLPPIPGCFVLMWTRPTPQS